MFRLVDAILASGLDGTMCWQMMIEEKHQDTQRGENGDQGDILVALVEIGRNGGVVSRSILSWDTSRMS